jgi:hypothetical protein
MGYPPMPYNTMPMDMGTRSHPPGFGPRPLPDPLPPGWAPKWPDLLGNHRKAQSNTETRSNSARDAIDHIENTNAKGTSSGPRQSRSQVAATPHDDGASQQASANLLGADAPDLASVLSRTATEYLGLDLLGDDPQSQFFVHLLNDIERLQAQVRVLKSRSHKALHPPAPKPVTPMEISPQVLKPRLQVLHRVYYNHETPMGNRLGIYADQPEHVELEGAYKQWVLAGKNPILDLNSYLRDHPDICLVVFREYGDGKPRVRSKPSPSPWP